MTKRGLIESTALILAAVSVFSGFFGASLLSLGRPFEAAGLHFLAAGFGWRAALITDRRRLGDHWFAFFLPFCVPFFGGGVTYILCVSVKFGKAGDLAEEFAAYLSDAATFRESVPIRTDEVLNPENLVSLSDILAAPITEAEQRVAVEHLAGMESPAAIEILQRVIESDSGDARFFAMTAIGQIEERLLNRIQRMEEDMRSGREFGAKIRVDAARAYIDFSYYQLAQESMRNDYLERAEKLLEKALGENDCGPETLILLGRVGLLRYDLEKALARFNSCLETDPENVGVLLWRAEAFYGLGEYEKTRKDCLAAEAIGHVPDSILGTVRFWCGEERIDDPAADMVKSA
ncbi:MAG: hypothetical protein LBE84_05055 [Planctomycetota bacterium]|jgi:tetratricopeptide (TPR) repeat protein|nr:hypothetical protein [Planctomycetota bacterium]